MDFFQISLKDFRFRQAGCFNRRILTVYFLPQGFCCMPGAADYDIDSNKTNTSAWGMLYFARRAALSRRSTSLMPQNCPKIFIASAVLFFIVLLLRPLRPPFDLWGSLSHSTSGVVCPHLWINDLWGSLSRPVHKRYSLAIGDQSAR